MDENSVVLYGTAWCGDCRRTKRALERRGVGYSWVDIEKAKGAREEMLRLNGGERRIPTLLLSDGSVLVEPSERELGARLDELAVRAASAQVR